MTVRLGVAAAIALVFAAGSASAQDAELPETPEESRALLEQSCRDGGMAAATCSCLGDFVDANFTDRELAGAALVFSEPLYAADPAAGIAALLDEGYAIEEIAAVAERVMTLEDAATSQCAVPEEGADETAD